MKSDGVVKTKKANTETRRHRVKYIRSERLLTERFKIRPVLLVLLTFLQIFTLFLLPSYAETAGESDFWYIQTGTFRGIDKAQKAYDDVKGLPHARIEEIKGLYKVRVGQYADRKAAEDALAKISKSYPHALIVKRTRGSVIPVQVNKIADKKPQTDGIKTLYLEDLGHSSDIQISGVAPEFSIFLPRIKGFRSADIELSLRFSGVLDRFSTVSILIDDIPLFTRNISQTGYAPVLSFKVRPSKADFIKVTVRGHFSITGDICYDVPTGNLWMVISKRSKLLIDASERASSVANFFRNYDTDLNIAFAHQKINPGILPLVYHVNRLNNWKDVKISFSEKPVEGKRNVVLGDFVKDLDVEKENSYVVGETIPTRKREFDVKKGNLYVSEKGIPLIKKEFMDLYITDSMENSRLTREENPKKEITLRDIGLGNLTATGLGDLSFNIPLIYSDFHGAPKNPYLKLFLVHTPVHENDRAFLKIFLNGILIKAEMLTGGGNINSYDIKIPTEQLKGYRNNLAIVASYFINRGECKGSFPNMTLSVLDSSYFYYDEVTIKNIHSINDIMGSMSGRTLVMTDSNQMISHAVSLIDILGKFNKGISDIDVAKWEGSIPEGYDFVILALEPSSTKMLDVPLKVNKGRFSIENPLTKADIFNSEYKDGFGVLESFDHEKSKILLLTFYKEINALNSLKEFGMDDINKLLGNVAIFNTDMVSYDIGDKFRIIYKEVKSLSYYWAKFKLLIILAISLAVLIFLFLVWKSLVRGRDSE